MTIYLAQSSIDENGNIHGGQAGNQSGKELNTTTFYSSSSRPWLFILRAADERVRAEVVKQAKAGVANPYIGYDQWERNTLLSQAKAANWQLANIKTPCETDCSAFGAVCIIAAVYNVLGSSAGDAVYNALYAGGNLPATMNMKQKGQSCSPYITVVNFNGSGSLQNGDVLTRDGHTVIVVDGAIAGATLTTGTTSVSSNTYPCKGWKGESVKNIQRALINKGYSCGNSGVDGDFGKDTNAAVIAFQRDNGLEQDGIVGPLTQAKLFASGGSSSNVSYSTGLYITCVSNLNVRTGAGTNYRKKAKNELTADGQKHSNANGQLNSGTAVTVYSIKKDNEGNPWANIPSGWICINWRGEVYAKKA